MVDPRYDHPDLDFERKVRGAFPVPEPDPVFVHRLQREIMERYEASGKASRLPVSRTHLSSLSGWAKLVLSPLAWAIVALLLIVLLIWGINNLIPKTVPGVSVLSSPSPTLTEENAGITIVSPTQTFTLTPGTTPTPGLPAVPNLSLENAVFYTVEEGDTLSGIANKTGIPEETLQGLNEFVLQLNGLVPGLQLVIGFNGQEPVFHTVGPGDTLFGIAEQAGISMEELVALNRIGEYAPGVPTPRPVPHGILSPGMRVIIGLEKTGVKNNEWTGGKQIILSETDLNCDNQVERLLGIEAPEIEYFNIHPQLSTIILEATSGTSTGKVWEYTAEEAGVAYLAYQLFQADECNQFLVLIGHKGKEGVRVLGWDGEQMDIILSHPGRFLFEGAWMEELFGDYEASTGTLILGELQQSSPLSKNIWIQRGYRWDGEALKMMMIKRVELAGGG